MPNDGTTVQLQAAIVARLRATPAVTALCPAANIFDRSMRPEVPISIVLGEDQVVFEGITLAGNHVSIFTTLHLWNKAQDTLSREGYTVTNSGGGTSRHPAVGSLREFTSEARRLAAELGLTPTSRNKVGEPPEDSDELSEFGI